MNIQSTTIQSTGSSNSTNRSLGHQRQDDPCQARCTSAERDFGIGYGGRGYASNPDYLRTRYAASQGCHRFRIS